MIANCELRIARTIVTCHLQTCNLQPATLPPFLPFALCLLPFLLLEFRMKMPPLETDRLLIRPFQMDDFEALNLKRILANTDYDNLASQSAMRKLGMTILRNPEPEPPWMQIIAVLENTRQV
jgi:hypothetical protein